MKKHKIIAVSLSALLTMALGGTTAFAAVNIQQGSLLKNTAPIAQQFNIAQKPIIQQPIVQQFKPGVIQIAPKPPQITIPPQPIVNPIRK